MIIFGIATTPDTDLDGHILLRGAIDCEQRVPLCYDHDRQIGQIIRLHYAGDKLYVWAETDDPVAARLDYFSAAGRAIERQRHGNVWHVSKLSLTEISLTNRPVNKHCVVRERHETDPARDLCQGQATYWSLMAKRVDCLQRLVTMIGETKEVRL